MVEHAVVQLADQQLDHHECACFEVLAGVSRYQQFFLGNADEFDHAIKDQLEQLVVHVLACQTQRRSLLVLVDVPHHECRQGLRVEQPVRVNIFHLVEEESLEELLN